jgi:hypothetical protein
MDGIERFDLYEQNLAMDFSIGERLMGIKDECAARVQPYGHRVGVERIFCLFLGEER